MRKRKTLVILGAAAVLLALAAVLLRGQLLRSHVSADEAISIQFERDGAMESHEVSAEEGAQLRRVLSGRPEHREAYSCGFSPSLSITAGESVFYVASDGCPIVYDVSTGRYFRITGEEKRSIAEVFAGYGGTVYWE